MQLLGMRHGHSGAANGLEDSARFLSARGRAEAREIARALAERGVTLDLVLTSPLVRAVQTAELVAAGLGYQGEVCSLPALAYTTSPEEAAHALQTLSHKGELRSVLAVGHMPTLPVTLHELSGGSTPSSLATAQVVCIEAGANRWTIAPQAH